MIVLKNRSKNHRLLQKSRLSKFKNRQIIVQKTTYIGHPYVFDERVSEETVSDKIYERINKAHLHLVNSLFEYRRFLSRLPCELTR